MREMKKSIVSSHSFALNAHDNQGFIVFRLIRDAGFKRLYIYEYHTLKQFQNRGVGKQLLARITQIARDLGIE